MRTILCVVSLWLRETGIKFARSWVNWSLKGFDFCDFWLEKTCCKRWPWLLRQVTLWKQSRDEFPNVVFNYVVFFMRKKYRSAVILLLCAKRTVWYPYPSQNRSPLKSLQQKLEIRPSKMWILAVVAHLDLKIAIWEVRPDTAWESEKMTCKTIWKRYTV